MSKISTKRNETNTIKNLKERTFEKSKLSTAGAEGRLIGDQPSQPPKGTVIFKGMPMMVVIKIPIKIAPGTLKIKRAQVITKPIRAKTAGEPQENSPSPTRVAGLSTIMPEF